MHRKSGRTSLAYPTFLCLSLLMFAVPESGVNSLRASVYSALRPVLSFSASSARSNTNEPKAASVQIVIDPQNETTRSQDQMNSVAAEYDRKCAAIIRYRAALQKAKGLLSPKDAGLDDPSGIDADVIARRVMWQEPMLGIDKGSAEGVRGDAGVMHRGAVVGRIVATGPHFSSMALLTDPSMRIGARLVDCRVEGILQGQKAGAEGTERYCRLKIVAKELKAVVGEQVVTSGLDTTFPAGLWLGAVVKINRTGDFQWELIVRPACDENRIESVHVLTGETPEVPWPQMPGTKPIPAATAPKAPSTASRSR